MATRIYFPSTGNATISPAYDAGWEVTTGAGTRLKAVTTKINSAMATLSQDDGVTTDQDLLLKQWVLEVGLRAQTIAAQTVKIQCRVATSNTSATLFLAWEIRAFDSTGTTSRGTLVGSPRRDGTSTSSTTLTNRGDSLTSTAVTVQDGDFLVFELGMGGTASFASGGHDPQIRIGDASGTDLPENNTATTDDNPWIEFANEILFGPLPPHNRVQLNQAVQRAATR